MNLTGLLQLVLPAKRDASPKLGDLTGTAPMVFPVSTRTQGAIATVITEKLEELTGKAAGPMESS